MKKCPECLYTYQDHAEICSDCDVPLEVVKEEEEENIEMPIKPKRFFIINMVYLVFGLLFGASAIHRFFDSSTGREVFSLEHIVIIIISCVLFSTFIKRTKKLKTFKAKNGID